MKLSIVRARWSWNWCSDGLELGVSIRLCPRCAMMNHQPHGDMKVEAVEVVVMAKLPFWFCSSSSCQVNQKYYASNPPLLEREGRLVIGNYTSGIPHLAMESHLLSQGRRKIKESFEPFLSV